MLRVRGLGARPLPAAGPERGVALALAGYPRNGPLTRTPARLGGTAQVLSRDAYGRGPVRRQVTAIRGVVEPGSSGGPGIDAQGRVRTTVFARRPRETGGYGIPIELVQKVVAQARRRPFPRPTARRRARSISPLREEIQRGVRLPERRDHVHACGQLA